MFRNSFEGRTVLVTGDTGFKGTWLAIWLRRLGANVVGYALDPLKEPNIFVEADLTSEIDHVRGDIRDEAALAALIARCSPDFVFHLAAQPLVRESYRVPRETFAVNVLGTLTLLDAIRVVGRPCVVIVVSTDKCYENREWAYGYRENDALGGHDPYSASKAAMEIAVASYRQSFFSIETVARHGVRLASARAGNVIGGGDWSIDRLVPDAVRAFARGEPLEVRNPDAIRPWQHVLDPLAGYLWLAARLAEPEGERFSTAWNFGPPSTETHSVAELADALVAVWEGAAWVGLKDVSEPHEAHLLRLCTDKASAELGWSSIWDFSTSVERTARWYWRVLASSTSSSPVARQACLDDIVAYEATALERGSTWTR